MAIVKTYAKLFIALAVLFAVFRYIAAFSTTQSCVLGLVSVIGWDIVEGLRNYLQIERKFAPFWVQVSPNWHCLMQDYKVVQNDEETFWQEIQKNNSSISTDAYLVLRDGITFTVLNPRIFESLIYWNSHRIFRSEVEFRERIEEIKLGSKIGLRWSPYIYFKWGREGYELGLEVNADWWKDMCAADATNQLDKIKTHPEFLTGTTRLLVAMLPYSEFGVYSAGNTLSVAHDMSG